MNCGIVVTHGDLGREMVRTLKSIVGETDIIQPLSFKRGDDIDTLEKEIRKFIGEDEERDVFIFTDVFGGSCSNTAMKIIKDAAENGIFKNQVAVFAGVSLPMLISFTTLAKVLPLDKLRDIIREESKKAVVDIGAMVEKRGGK